MNYFLSPNTKYFLCSLDGSPVAGLGHLQRQPHHQLHEGVEDDVLHVDVDELVGEEPPDLTHHTRIKMP